MKRSFQDIQEEELRLKAELPADRHCLQGNQDGYKIACDMTFSRILDHDTAEERPYKSRSNESKTVLHWGQRKLMLAEIEFLTEYYETGSWVVYAGAAPGTHIRLLAKMFPKLRFVLIDCRPFSDHLNKAAKELLWIDGTPRIRCEQKYFTDETAKEFEHSEGVLFISDVRTSKDAEEGDDYPSQKEVEDDMRVQERWHLLMKPVASCFKFRLPWDAGSTKYLNGTLHLPVWGPATTTESRLFVEFQGLDSERCFRSYDNRKYEQQMFYFNTHRRIAKYKHEFEDYFRCCCFDCTSEAAILTKYLQVVQPMPKEVVEHNPHIAAKDVPGLSRLLDFECHRDYQDLRSLVRGNPDPTERRRRIQKRQTRAKVDNRMSKERTLSEKPEASYARLRQGLDVDFAKDSQYQYRRLSTFFRHWVQSSPEGLSSHTRKALHRIVRAGRSVLRPGEIREALSSIPPMVLPGDAVIEDGEDSDKEVEAAEFHSITDCEEETQLEGFGYGLRKADFPQGDGEHSWNVIDASTYRLRSEKYFVDGSKEPSCPAMLQLLDVDVSQIGPRGPVVESARHPDFSCQAIRRGGDGRFLFILNFILPPYQAIMTAAVDPSAAWLSDPASPQARVWHRFLAASHEDQKKKLKVIFSVETGPWVVKKVALKKPTLIGMKISMESHYQPEDYLEITLDVTNGGRGGGYEEMVTRMVLRHVKSLECGLCCLIEATQEDELPECALFAFLASHPDFERMALAVSD
eukprot:s385_g4.t1